MLETKIEELTKAIKMLIETLDNNNTKKTTKKREKKDPVKILEVNTTPADNIETGITIFDIKEVAKSKIFSGKTTKDDVQGIIKSLGFEKLSDIVKQSDLMSVLTKISAL